MSDFKITKREIQFSIIIICVMICIGFFIGNFISNKVMENDELYYSSTKINNDKNQFDYGMKTSINNTMIYGNFNTDQAVTLPELKNSYLTINRITERYTMHTRVVTHHSGKTTYTTVETYYTWDTCNDEYFTSNTCTFLNDKFNPSIFKFNYELLNLSDTTIQPAYQSKIGSCYLYNNGFFSLVGDLRFEYYIVPKNFNATIFANLKNNSIYGINKDSDKIDTYNQTINQVIEDKKNSENKPLIIFWICWSILIIAGVIVFYKYNNTWLEDKN
jgi:hypothetical protein